MTAADAQARAHEQGLPRFEAQMLALHAAGRSSSDRAWLLTHDDFELDAASFEALVQRRLSGEPMAYITGQRGFFGLDLAVDARVLDPRPDTETLVEWALTLQFPQHARALDLGTGSGPIALALASQRPSWTVCATDLSVDALAVARANAVRLGLAVPLFQGAWFDALPPNAERFDLIASNPPYIANGDPHLARLAHEPALALTSGADGLDAIREIVSKAPQHLKPGGWLLLEHGFDQAAEVRQLLANRGFVQVESRPDLGGNLRCSGGRLG